MEWRRTRIQDFEMRCWMEHRSVFQPWEHLRNGSFTFMFGDAKLLGNTTEEQRIAAFEQGKTGYPMVDACMRCLHQTGWLNFRMRCMLASFATFNLWLDWRAIKGHLARCFLDYEPGIHYVQLQLHAGTFGGMCHCYNVTKQAKEHDPDGTFIRKYIPELASISDVAYLHEPWKLSERPASRSGGRRWASRYPLPIVNDRLTAEASRKVIESAQQEAHLGTSNSEKPEGSESESEDQLLQLALETSVMDECQRIDGAFFTGYHSQDRESEGWKMIKALQEQEDLFLKQAIEASLGA
jgi:deoxyribodipyrimidine photo-lyase